MKHTILLALVAFAVVLLILTNVFLLSAQTKTQNNLEIVKSQLSNAKSGLVTFSYQDYFFVSITSIASFIIGLGTAYLFFEFLDKTKKK